MNEPPLNGQWVRQDRSADAPTREQLDGEPRDDGKVFCGTYMGTPIWAEPIIREAFNSLYQQLRRERESHEKILELYR